MKSELVEYEIPEFDPGSYQFFEDRIVISDQECGLFVDEEFNPVRVPEVREDGANLGNGYVLRVFYDGKWKLDECYVEKNGIPDGQALLFYPDGSVKEESFYLKGRLHGPSRFFGDGEIKNVLAESYFRNGLRQGQGQWYYPSGSLYSLQRFKDGVWDGPQEFYYEDGQLKTLMYYERGKLSGKPLLLQPDGSLDRVPLDLK